MISLQLFFYILSFSVIYCYFIYPILIYYAANSLEKKIDKHPIEPTVSIIISAYNEEEYIKNKIENLLCLDYPSSKLEIIVGSDGSTDRTNEILQQFSSPYFNFYPYLQRRGKMATINDLVQQAQHEIVVFTDARQSFDINTVRELVANFNDPKIGCVSGELCFKSLADGGTAKGIDLYWNYEKFLRRHESKLHSMLGATGAIYAIRRELFVQIPRGIILDDMFVPLKIIERGFRAVFEPSAKAYDTASNNPKEEYRRKVRTLYGNYQIFYHFLGLFNPLNSPIAFQLFSHKFLRVVMPFALILLVVTNILLFNTAATYKIFLASQLGFYLLAAIGLSTKNSSHGFLKIVSKISYAPYMFCLLNFSALIGFLRLVRQKQAVTWEKARVRE